MKNTPSISSNKIAYQQSYFLSENNVSFKHRIKKDIKTQNLKPLQDILNPLNPLHGGIGFVPISETSSRITLLVTTSNRINPRIIEQNHDIIHTCVFVNDDKIFEATPSHKKSNGLHDITQATKDKSSIYISQFPILNIMIVQEMDNLKGGKYNFLGTINCVIGEKIVPPLKENDFFCSQMLLKAIKNALERYGRTPFLPYKTDIQTISKNIEHLDVDTTLPAEIKQAFDKMPEYFRVITPKISK